MAAPSTGDPTTPTPTELPPGSAASREGAGSAALVLGVVAVGVAVFPLLFWAGWLLGAVAVFLGLVALRRVRAGLATGRGSALAGLVLGVAAIPLGLVGMLVLQAAYTGRTVT